MGKICSVLACTNEIDNKSARGYCGKHYKRFLNHGTTEAVGVPGVGKGQRKTHCKRGHILIGDNLRIYLKKRTWGVQTKRECRNCYKLSQEKYYRRLAAGEVVK